MSTTSSRSTWALRLSLSIETASESQSHFARWPAPEGNPSLYQGKLSSMARLSVVHEGRCSELQAELAAGRQVRLVYYAFDLLWRNGDLRRLPPDRTQPFVNRSKSDQMPVLHEHVNRAQRRRINSCVSAQYRIPQHPSVEWYGPKRGPDTSSNVSHNPGWLPVGKPSVSRRFARRRVRRRTSIQQQRLSANCSWA